MTTPVATADKKPTWTAADVLLLILLIALAAGLWYGMTRGTGAVGTGMF